MKLFRSFDDIAEKLPNPVVTIGNFDGVHLGHREIFRRLRKAAAAIDGVSVVITFVPHPLKVLAPERCLPLINTYEEKELLMEASGIDYLITVPFNREFAEISADSFVRDLLVGRIGTRKLIIGYDYAFGKKREGNVDLLTRLGSECGFSVDVLGPIGDGEMIFSSTTVRRMILDGEVVEVVNLLGRHYSVGGKVVPGLHRGKQLGFPTANLETEKELIPKPGVYAVKVKVDDAEIFDGACNIGNNPTFGNESITLEVHIFDYDGDLYGHEVRVYFVERLRDEQTFPSIEALKEGIERDVRRCRQLLQGVSIIEYREYLGSI